MAENKKTEKSTASKVVTTSDVVYMIYSRATLRDIRVLLEPYLKSGRLSSMHHQIDRFTGKETNRVVTVMDKSLYDALCKALDDDTFDRKEFGYFNIVPVYV